MGRKRLRAPSAIVAGAGLTVAALLRNQARRAKTRQLVIKVRNGLLPARGFGRTGAPLAGDPAHAPGHRHLPPVEPQHEPTDIEHGSHTVVRHDPGHVHKG